MERGGGRGWSEGGGVGTKGKEVGRGGGNEHERKRNAHLLTLKRFFVGLGRFRQSGICRIQVS